MPGAEGLPELVGHLDHVHEAGIHAEEVDLPAQERADPGQDHPQLPVVQGIAAGGVVVADAAVGLWEGVIEERTVRPFAGWNGCPALGILPPAAAVVPEDQGVTIV